VVQSELRIVSGVRDVGLHFTPFEDIVAY